VTGARKDVVGLRAMVRAGGRAVSEYTGMVLGLFVIQAMVAFGSGLVVTGLLTSRFAERPIFDDAVDGDAVSLLEVLRSSGMLVSATVWILIGTALLWVMLSWFLTGGILAVLTERPRDRRETARCFGAGGAATFFVFVRLGLLSLVVHGFVVGGLATVGLGVIATRFEHTLRLGPLVLDLLAALTPALLAAVAVGTVFDYARAELALRRPTHDHLGAFRAMIRAVGFMVRRPAALAHVMLGWTSFLAVSLVYVWASHGHPMLGATGAVALFVIRQGLSLARMAIKVGVIGGQVELGQTRPPPPRKVVDGE